MFDKFRNNNNYEEYKEELKKMDHKDLISFRNIYTNISRIMSFCGVSVFILMLIFFNVFVLVLGPILIYWLGGIGVICDRICQLINAQLQEVNEVDK